MQDEIATLMAEHVRVSTDIRSIETANDKVLGLALAVVGAGCIWNRALTRFLLCTDRANYGATLPDFPIFNLFSFGGCKRALEDRVNQLSGRVVLCWEPWWKAERDAPSRSIQGYTQHIFSSPLVARDLWPWEPPDNAWSLGRVVNQCLPRPQTICVSIFKDVCRHQRNERL